MKIVRFKNKAASDEVFIGELQEDIISPARLESHLISDVFRAKTIEIEISINEVELLPVVEPSKIVCVGRNYAAHATELGNPVPETPLLFLKAPSSIVGAGSPIVIPGESNQVEHEAELGLLIGKKAKDIGADEAPLDYIFGYTCVNDVTARDIQKHDVQFTRAKSFDTFCPVGPYVQTDFDADAKRVIARVNGKERQCGATSEMIFDIPYLIRYISRQMTLLPGDLIATGTPAGVSKMNAGDVCEIEIENLGILANPVEGKS